MSKIINITKSAEEYLAKLVADKDDESIGIKDGCLQPSRINNFINSS